jgi:hypothetical protein
VINPGAGKISLESKEAGLGAGHSKPGGGGLGMYQNILGQESNKLGQERGTRTGPGTKPRPEKTGIRAGQTNQGAEQNRPGARGLGQDQDRIGQEHGD